MKGNGPRDINTAMANSLMLRPIEFIKESLRTASLMGWVCSKYHRVNFTKALSAGI